MRRRETNHLLRPPPQQPKVEEWEKHQTIHTAYAPWCQHCNAARAVRRDHARIQQRARIAKDVDGSRPGPAKISMDYMYLCERKGRHNEGQWNPPRLVVTEHRFGRVWAHLAPNKGIHDGASWFPR